MRNYPWLWTPGLYVVDETEDGDELVLSGPWFCDEEAEADRFSWGNAETLTIVGWLHEEAA